MHRWTQTNPLSSSCFTKDCCKDSLRNVSSSTAQMTSPLGQKQHRETNETGSSRRPSKGKEANRLTPLDRTTLLPLKCSPGTIKDKGNEEVGPDQQDHGCPLQTPMLWMSAPHEKLRQTWRNKSIDKKEDASNAPSKATSPKTAH
jgi:hypothetical protein